MSVSISQHEAVDVSLDLAQVMLRMLTSEGG